MIDLDELNRIVNERSIEMLNEKMKHHTDEVEKFICTNLIKNAREGKHELEIIFKIRDFLDFHSVMMNYLKHRNECNINVCADEIKEEFVISEEMLNEFLNKMASLEDDDYLEFFYLDEAWKNYMRRYLLIDVNFIKMKINF